MSTIENDKATDNLTAEQPRENEQVAQEFTEQIDAQRSTQTSSSTNVLQGVGNWVSANLPNPQKIFDDLKNNLPNPLESLNNIKDIARESLKPLEDEVKGQISQRMAKMNVPPPEELRAALKKTGTSEEKFVQNALNQLEQNGEIKVGVQDFFEKNKRTHGTTVSERFKGSLPDYLNQHVKVEQYDVTTNPQKNTHKLMKDLNQNRVVAASFSLGLPAVNLEKLEKKVGSPVNDTNLNQFIPHYLQATTHFREHQYLERNLEHLKHIKAPVVSPVLNNGVTSGATFTKNVIITSIKEKNGQQTDRTEAPGAVDIEVNPLPGTTMTSQSAPVVLGGLFHLIPQEKVEQALAKYHQSKNIAGKH